MIEGALVEAVSRELRQSGLRELPLDGPSDGGFAVQPDVEVIYVVWSASDRLSTVALELLSNGETDHPSVFKMGRIQHIMADAILEILVAGGFDAVMSRDDLSPATVEVRSAGAGAR
ncbi:hypothetical protein O7635_09125 [Asanoa sp. WMMD1127]|uniref:hypothetical protein n=1 Tax=Asanoa sp. WMMD1127 TaxID=3016107 RepID=UPI002415DAB2|nr:hypothetical protein [Asanoa sp. WMMD1127]MDG4822015.1 hypothetical protein [Asanoa sp. WMMD1127]